jgi:hypothetical protein
MIQCDERLVVRCSCRPSEVADAVEQHGSGVQALAVRRKRDGCLGRQLLRCRSRQEQNDRAFAERAGDRAEQVADRIVVTAAGSRR